MTLSLILLFRRHISETTLLCEKLSDWERIAENSRAAVRYVSFGYMTVGNGFNYAVAMEVLYNHYWERLPINLKSLSLQI